MPDILKTNKDHAKHNASLIGRIGGDIGGALGGIWHWINGVANGIGHFLGGPVLSALRAILAHLEVVVDAVHEVISLWARTVFWFDRLVWHVVAGWIAKLKSHTRAELMAQVKRLIRLIYVTTNTVLMLAYAQVRRERNARVKAIARAVAMLRRDIKASKQAIEREAASGYRVGQEDRLNLIVRLLDFAVLRNPELGALVRDIAGGVLDLLSVDDPLARLVLGFLIKHVIDRLGIDKAVGTLIQGLLAPILGKPKPDGIHDVVMDLSDRMIASEKQWAQFMEDGGSQVEQAGREWRDITSVAGTIAIVAFTAEAVHNPTGWAAAISDTVGAAANDVLTRAAALFEGG